MGIWVSGLGFWVLGLGFRVDGSSLGLWNVGAKGLDSGLGSLGCGAFGEPGDLKGKIRL